MAPIALANISDDICYLWLDFKWYFFLLLELMAYNFELFAQTTGSFFPMNVALVECFYFWPVHPKMVKRRTSFVRLNIHSH